MFDDGAAQATLPLVRKGTQMRALTAPYTTIYAPALSDPRWARFLSADAQRYVAGSLRLDALDPGDTGVAAFLEGVESSGLIAAKYRHFFNRDDPVLECAAVAAQGDGPQEVCAGARGGRTFAVIAKSSARQLRFTKTYIARPGNRPNRIRVSSLA